MVLSQWSGSNRGGFRIVPSNTRGTINLDGVFNIISYDVVPKLQKILAESEFKVSAELVILHYFTSESMLNVSFLL